MNRPSPPLAVPPPTLRWRPDIGEVRNPAVHVTWRASNWDQQAHAVAHAAGAPAATAPPLNALDHPSTIAPGRYARLIFRIARRNFPLPNPNSNPNEGALLGRLGPGQEQLPVRRKQGWEIAVAAVLSVLGLILMPDPLLVAGQRMDLLALRQVDQPQQLVLAVADGGQAPP